MKLSQVYVHSFRLKYLPLYITKAITYMSRLMIKPTNWAVRPAKTQISLGIGPVWSESSLCDQWVAEDSMFLHASA